MNAKHTPGPWTVKSATSVVADGAQVASCGFKMGSWPKEDYDTEEANARLIAAAPDLLAACRWLIDQMAEPIHDGGDGGIVSDYARRYADARAAIARATGGGAS